MSQEPPDDPKGGRAPRRSRLVGSITDPNADDGLGLTGPGAPGGFSGAGEHPIKARLLARSRAAKGEATEEDLALIDGPRASAPPAPPAVGNVWTPAPESVAPQVSATDVDDEATSSARPLKVGPSAADDSDETHAERNKEPSQAALGGPGDSEHRAAPASHPAKHASIQKAPARTGPTPLPGAVASELERIARRSPETVREVPKLSPNMTALVSALLGLTLMGTLGLLLPQLGEPSQPKDDAPEAGAKEAEKSAEAPKEEKPERQKIPGPWRVADDKDKPGHRLLQGKIGKEPFLRAIQDAGLPKSEAYRAYTALKGELNLDRCKSSDVFRALISGGDKHLVGFEYEKSKEEVYQAKADDAGHLKGARLDLKVERNQIRRAFIHDGRSFEESARRAGFDPGLSETAETALRGHTTLSELKAGDRLRFIAQEVTVLGEFSRYAGVEALEITQAGKDPVRIYYFPHAVQGGYFDKNGRAPYEGGWRKPIPGAPITSKFNPNRMHPVLKKVMPHTGTDFGAPSGTPIGSTSPGTVSFIGPAGRAGNYVRVKHEGGYESGYAHLSKFEPGLKVGDKVDRLQTIGYCGSTGSSTGPHLHFVMKKDGQYIDAETLNLDGMRVLPPSFRAEFEAVRAKYDPILDAIVLPEAAALPAEAAAGVPDVPASSDDPSSEEGDDADDPMAGSLDSAEAEAPAAAPTPTAPSAPSAPGAPAVAVAPSAIFLSDQELLKMQAASDDGEVTQ